MFLKAAAIFGDIAITAAAEAAILSGLTDDIFILSGVEGYHLEIVEHCMMGIHATH